MPGLALDFGISLKDIRQVSMKGLIKCRAMFSEVREELHSDSLG
jgi:hypothetical protein